MIGKIVKRIWIKNLLKSENEEEISVSIFNEYMNVEDSNYKK